MARYSMIDQAKALPPPQFSPLTAGPFKQMYEQDRAFALQTEEAAADFLDQATDVEAMLLMSEASLRAPLNDVGHKLMMHLCHKVFARAGIPNIPAFVEQAKTLDAYHQDKLTRFKRDIRTKQKRGRKDLK